MSDPRPSPVTTPLASQIAAEYAPDMLPSVAAPADLSGASPEAAGAEGGTEGLSGQRVNLRGPDGRVVNIDASELPAAVRRGYTPLSAAEVQGERDVEEERNAPLGGLKAGLRGAARTITLGTYDKGVIEATRLLEGDQAADEARRSLVASREAHPVASGLGEVAGMFAPTGIAGLVGKGARAAGAGLVGILAREGAGLGERIAVRGLAGAAAGAGEGALYGAGQQISEDALGATDVTAEKLFAAAGKGALFGGLMGGTLVGGAKLLEEGGSAARRGLASVADSASQGLASVRGALGEGADAAIAKVKGALPGAGDLLAGNVQGATDAIGSALETAAGRFIKRTDDPAVERALNRVWKEGRLNAQAQEEMLDAETRRVVAAAKPALDAERTIYEVALEQKGENMARLVDPAKRLPQKTEALNIWQQGRDLVDFWGPTATKGGLEGGLKKFDRVLRDFESAIGDAVSKGTAIEHPERAYMLLDQLKRDAGHFAQFGRDPWARAEAAAGKAVPSFEGFYNAVRSSLEREDVWGAAALAQKEINAAHTAALSTRENFGRWFVEKYGSQAGEPLYELGPGQVKSFLASIDDAATDLKARSVTDYVAGMRAKMNSIEKHFALSPQQAGQFAKARAGLSEMEAAFSRARGEAEHVATIRRMKAAELERTGLDMLAPVGGALVAGPVGAAAGLAGSLAVDAFARPLSTVERLRMLKQTTEKFDRALAGGIADYFSGARPAAAKAYEFSRPKLTALAKRVTEMASNAGMLVDRVGKTFGDVARTAPKVASALGDVSTRAILFLATKAPRETSAPTSLTPHLDGDAKFSDVELAKFARYARAIDRGPEAIIEDLHHGRIDPESIEVLREVYPRLYEQVQNEMREHLRARREPLPWAKALQVGMLLDVPAHPSLAPEAIAAVQAVKEPVAPDEQEPAAGGQRRGGGRRPAKIDRNSIATESERIEAS